MQSWWLALRNNVLLIIIRDTNLNVESKLKLILCRYNTMNDVMVVAKPLVVIS